jgi:endonuclease/exonuclease/phosphatase (EEP) superfamily protein YafD
MVSSLFRWFILPNTVSWRAGVHRFSWIIAGLALPGTLAPYFGRLTSSWLLLELLGNLVLPYSLLLSLLLGGALVARLSRPILGVLGFLLAVNTYTVVQSTGAIEPALAGSEYATVRVATFNLFVGNRNMPAAVAALREAGPDLLGLQEVSPEWGKAIGGLASTYPYTAVYPEPGCFGAALFSRFPITRQRFTNFGAAMPSTLLATVTLPTGAALEVAVVHTLPPLNAKFLATRNNQLRLLGSTLGGVPHSLILADFNASTWMPILQETFPATVWRNSREGYGALPTLGALGPLGIPVDHILVSRNIVVSASTAGPDLGSDHLPLFAELRVPVGGQGVGGG